MFAPCYTTKNQSFYSNNETLSLHRGGSLCSAIPLRAYSGIDIMARKDLPYMKFYVQDFLTDEQLRECKPESVGVFAFMLCYLFKQEVRGTILLKQNEQQTDQQILNFASKLAKHLPYSTDIIVPALRDLLDHSVLRFSGETLVQKRMYQDNILSDKRSASGSEGGKKTALLHFALAKVEANGTANPDSDSDSDSDSKKEKAWKIIPPDLQWVKDYFKEKGYPEKEAIKLHNFYASKGWKVGKQPMKDWQACCRTWFGRLDELKITPESGQVKKQDEILKPFVPENPPTLNDKFTK